MTNEGLSKLAFNSLDRITDFYPPFGKQVIQKVILFILGSAKLYNYFLHKYQKKLLEVKDFSKILIVADVNIGDSINTQPGIEVLRYFFPDSQIDYVCNKTGGEVLSGSPFVNNVFKIYSNSGLPKEEDTQKINKIVENGNYSLILNMSPFLGKKILKCNADVIHIYIVFVSYIIYLWKKNSVSLNEGLATYTFFRDFFSHLFKSDIFNSRERERVNLKSTFDGNKVFISNEAIESAMDLLKKNDLYPSRRLLIMNLTVTIKYSMIPVEIQLQTLKDVVESDDITAVLIYKGNSTIEIERIISEKLPEKYKRKMITIPSTININEFTALIDFCDMFVSGNTGTVHIAASRKINIDTKSPMRNRTSVVSVFGASESKIYSYDSERYGHSPANQEAPSKVFVGEAPCRTSTCINRIVKTCREVRCFHGLKAEDISSYINSYFKNLKEKESVSEKINVYNNGPDNNTQ